MINGWIIIGSKLNRLLLLAAPNILDVICAAFVFLSISLLVGLAISFGAPIGEALFMGSVIGAYIILGFFGL